MKLKSLFVLFFSVVILSCESNETVINSDNLLIGYWVEPSYNGEITTFKRSSSMPKESYGMSFNANNIFIERTSGFCGTPPLTYFNVQGTFELENTIISISTNSYPSNFAWRIVSISETELVVKREITDQEKEYRKLMDLFNNISNLAYSKACSNSLDWSYVAYGVKACGGPQGYIPYSKNIDTKAFLKKVEEYSKAEKEFNIKWGIASDCAVVNPPKSIECKNNYPVLKY